MSSKLLINERPLMVLPSLAAEIGLNEAIVLQQIHYWIEGNRERQSEQHYKEGRWWTYNTLEEWTQQFPWWSTSTLRRIFGTLQDRDLIFVEKLADSAYDRTNWYSINYETLQSLEPEWSKPFGQNEQMDKGQSEPMTFSQSEPMNNKESETNTETNTESVPADAGPTPEVEDDAPVKESETEPEQKPEPTDHQRFFGAVCECVGWDYQTLTKNQKGRVAQTLGVLKRADYTIDDLRTFYRWWFNDHWIGKKKGDHPTLNQLRAEIGKMKAKGESRNGKPWSRRSQKRSGRQAEPERDENGDTEADRIRRNLYGDEIAEQYRGMS